VEVYVDGKLMERPPLILNCREKDLCHRFKIGGPNKTVNLVNKIGPDGIILDVLCGLIPVIVDAATGSWYALTPKNVNVDFTSPGRFVPSPEPL